MGKLQLLNQLRKILESPSTVLTAKHLNKEWGFAKFSISPSAIDDIKITIDPRKDGPVGIVLHELVHIWILQNFDFPFSTELDEEITLTLEKLLWDHLREPKNATKLQSWSKAVDRKLGYETS